MPIGSKTVTSKGFELQRSFMECVCRLLQMLEEEKDKVSTWKEEQEELLHSLQDADRKINLLEAERDELHKAADETAWSEYRQALLQQTSEDKERIIALTEALDLSQNETWELQNQKSTLEEENRKLKEELAGGPAWEMQEVTLKLKVAEKQNRILELAAENESLTATVEQQQTLLEETQAEVEVLRKEVEEVSWAEERQALMQALEEEIDKGSTWEEERTALEQQLSAAMEENTALKTENADLSASFDELAWVKEREELCRALEEEKEKLSCWTEEMEALEEENKELKWVFHESKEKDLVIRDKEDAIESLNQQLENLQSRVPLLRIHSSNLVGSDGCKGRGSSTIDVRSGERS